MKNSHLVKERDHKALERRRMAAGRMFGRGMSQYRVAKRFKVSTAAANQWHKSWIAKGEDGLVSKGDPGFASAYTKEKKDNLKSLILKGPKKCGYDTDFWTVQRIAYAASKKLGIKLHITQTWRTIISLGFSCQKPERRAKERNERAIREWRIGIFQRLKKMGLS